jgi:hypothetical protein
MGRIQREFEGLAYRTYGNPRVSVILPKKKKKTPPERSAQIRES